MEIFSFPVLMSDHEARRIAEQKGGLLGDIIFRNRPMSVLRLHYIEYKLYKLEATYGNTALSKLFDRGGKKARRMEILILGNGTSGRAVIVDSHPKIITLEDIDEELIQETGYSGSALEANAKKLAMRVMHRLAGGIPYIEVMEEKSIFRPFWVAYYGELITGNKVRYLTIPADGCSSYRSF